MKPRLSLVVPGLLGRAGWDAAPPAPALARCLARARVEVYPGPLTPDELPFALWGIPAGADGQWPVATASAWADFAAGPRPDPLTIPRADGQVGDLAAGLGHGLVSSPAPGYWLRADPVHVRSHRDGLFLLEPAALPLATEEAGLLLAEIRAAAPPPLGELCVGACPRRWYIALPQAIRIRTVPIHRAVRGSLALSLIEGADAPAWRRWGNEVQMVLHGSTVNARREGAGLPQVNSLWLWGEGTLPAPSPPLLGRASHEIHGGGAVVRGLCRAAGGGALPLPPDFAAWRATAGAGTHWVILDDLWDAARVGDETAWEAGVAALEAHWLAPAVRALGRGALAALRVVTEDQSFEISPWALRLALWRRPHPLAHFRRPPPG
jgi:hypothetical protein